MTESSWRWVVTFRRPGRDTKVVYVSSKLAWDKDEAIRVARRKAPVDQGWELQRAVRGRG